jgi:hypothetical protein
MQEELTTPESIATIHPFEEAGLGLAPFRFESLTESVRNVGGCIQPTGHCHYCYTGIRYCCNIRSADGKRFVVGTDCVRKLNRFDNRMVSDVKRAEAKLARQKREEARKAKWEARQAEITAQLAAQRERNGDLTDAEVQQEAAAKIARESRDKVEAEMNEQNGWILDVLMNVGYASDFVSGMIDKLRTTPLKNLSPRCIDIIAGIYAKRAGRRNSKAYDAALEEFETKAGVTL